MTRHGFLALACAFPTGTPKTSVDACPPPMQKIPQAPEFAKHAESIIGGYTRVIGDAALPVIKEAAAFNLEARTTFDTRLSKNYDLPLPRNDTNGKKAKEEKKS